MNTNKEDYISEIYRLQSAHNRAAKVIELAHALDVSSPSVSEMIRRLEKQGLVTFEPFGGISLTTLGIKEARKLIRKHQLLEVFLTRVLGMKKDPHHEAHVLEHALSDDAADKLDEVLKKPDLCPDGHPIPKKGSEVVKLTQLPQKCKAEVVFVASKDKACLQRLNSLGLVPQAKVKLVRRLGKGPLILSVKGSQVALGADVCSDIFVEKK
jgi:DtxR family transcriptional regulator, Mn-dependent transcriptional regulator